MPVPVDEHGIRVDELVRVRADAVLLTPCHQHPTGAVLSGERRMALLEWLRGRGAFAIEDDYDAEYRYDRAPVGALQGLDPDRVVYAGSASKTLAPALRMGWLVLRRQRDVLIDALADELPEATVHGISAGLHATVQLPDGYREEAIVEEARRRRIELRGMCEYRFGNLDGPPTLLLGYGQLPEPSIRAGVRELAAAVRASRRVTAG